MQSLDSSCQEADFIINDTLKKLKGSNSANSSAGSTVQTLTSNNPTTATILRQQQQQLAYQHLPNSSTSQQPHKFQYHQLQSALQGTNVSSTAVNIGGGNNNSTTSCIQNVAQQQLSPPTPPSLVSSSFSVTFPPKSSLIDNSLLHCNISQIPSQPPLCIFEDDEEPSNPTDQPPVELLAPTNPLPTSSISNSGCQNQNLDSSINLDNIVILAQPTPPPNPSIQQHIPLSHPSPQAVQSTSYSNFNTITSPSPIVPDLLLSTPPGVHNSGSHNNNNSSNNNNSNKKADKRPSSSTSSSSVNHHHQHHYQHQHNHHAHNSHLLTSPATTGSPTSSPSKRQKIKESTSSKSSHSPSLSRSVSTSSSLGFSSAQTTSTNTFSSSSSTTSASKRENTSSHKFFNIHERIKDHYLQLLANDLNLFAEAGLKQRTRSFILERVVECERLNTIVINLYPGNKGYALGLYYDDRQVIPDTEGELSTSLSSLSSSISSSMGSVSLKNVSSRSSTIMINNSSFNSSKLYPSSIPPDLKQKTSCDHDGSFTDLSNSASEYSLVEVLRWPYENDQLLQCIDREVIPDFLMDMLAATTITLQAPQDDSTGTPRIFFKPNVFYAGCVVAQIRDFRQTFATSTNICDTRHVLLRPTNATLFADVQHVATTLNQNSSACAPEDKLALESQMVLATAEPLCLDPDPNIGRHAINSQHERQLFNTHELRRQMKKYTQISINRKRKLDQFTHHYGLELCDYLTRLRTRPRSGLVSTAAATAANISSTNAGVNPLVSATMLTSFASKVPKRPKDVIRPIRPPRLDYPANLKVPDQLISVEKYAKTNERPRETTDCQPQLIEEYILETERDDNEGRRVVYHIKLSIFQRPSNSEYLGELYVDRDYREGIRNGESCRFPLGTRVHANRYIQQFTEIFTEEGRKAVKITHLVPGHLPKVTHTGITPEQRQALILQQQQLQLQQQRQAALLAAQQQQQQQQVIQQTITQQQTEQPQPHQQQHLVVVGPNGQQQHLLPTTVQHLNTNTIQTQSQTVQQPQHVTKNINIVNVTGNNVAAVQHVLRHQQLHHHQQQQQQVATTQYIDANGATVQLQHATLTATTSNNNSNNTTTNTNSISGGSHHIQLQQITSSGPSSTGVVGVSSGGASTTTHQLSLSNGSLVLVQQHSATGSQTLHQQQTAQALQHAGITIQPASSHQQQKAQVITTTQMNNVQSAQNSALRTQLSSNVPILQAQLKAAPIVTNTNQQQQQQLVHKQNTANSSTNTTNVVTGNSGGSNSTTNTLQANPAISAIVTSIMNSANQWQQQQQQQNSASISNTSNTATTLKSSSNASILSLLNSAPAAMTSTPVASGTFTTSTGQTQQQQPTQQQNVTLVQHSSHPQQQQSQTATVVATENFVQATQSQAVPNQSQRKQNEVLQNLLNPGRKINIVSSSGAGSGGTTATFRTNAAGNLIAVNLNQASNHPQQQQNHQQQIHLHQQQHTQTQQHQQDQQPQTTVRVSMSALASQLASPPAIMTNSTNFGGYTLSTVSGTGSSGGSIKILNSGIQQQRVLANALRRDSLSSTSQGPPNAIVVGVAAPSPGSDSNASNASGFAVPQATSSAGVSGSNSTTLNALLANAATPSPSGSEHSQSSQSQNQSLLERLNSGGVTAGTALPNMSPQQHHPATPQQQYITKTLVQSPATSSIHSPMSSPHPQPSPSPHLPPPQQQQQPQQHQQQQSQTQTQTATLNLQGINFSTLQGAMANFPGLQNVQVQIPGFNQPISLQLTGGSLHAVQQPQQSGNSTVSVVAAGGSANASNNSSAVVTTQNPNSAQQAHQQQRSLLVSVPVSTANQQQGQAQHTITLQPQQLQQHSSATGTVVNLPAGAVATATGGTQTVVLTNNSGAGVTNTPGANNAGTNTSNTGTTMLTLPIAQLVGSGVQKLNSATLRTSSTSSTGVTTTNANTATGGSIIVQQQHSVQQQQKASHQPQQATITVSSTGTGSQTNQSIQLVGTIQQGGRNIQVVGTKQLAGSRQLITQRQIGGSTLKIAAASPINANSNTNLTSSANLTATPIVMSTQKLQLKTIKASTQHQAQQQQHQRILNQITASQASQTTPQQQTQTVILGQQQTTLASTQQQSTSSQHSQQQQHIQIQARAGSNLTQRTISAIAIAKQQQQQQQQQAAAAAAAAAVAAANRRRPATDVSK